MLLLFASTAFAAPKVPLRVVPAAADVPPGAPVEVAVVVNVPRGWHIYWENPGQSGIPTDATLRASSAGAPLAVDGPRWPVPARFEADGLYNYGYAGETAFVFTVTPLAEGPVTLTASVDWLLCKTACIPGSGEASATVTVRNSAPDAGAGKVARALAALPRPFAETGGTARMVDGALELRLPRPFSLFPATALEAVWAPVVAETAGGGVVVTTPVPAGPARLVLGDAQGRGFTLDLPLPESP